METPDQLIARARQQFELHGAPWNDRTEAALRNVVSPLFMALMELPDPDEWRWFVGARGCPACASDDAVTHLSNCPLRPAGQR